MVSNSVGPQLQLPGICLARLCLTEPFRAYYLTLFTGSLFGRVCKTLNEFEEEFASVGYPTPSFCLKLQLEVFVFWGVFVFAFTARRHGIEYEMDTSSTFPVIRPLCAIVLAIILAKVYTSYDAAARLRKLGSRASDAPHRLPFGEFCVT